MKRTLLSVLLAGGVLFAPASAYYHFVHYIGGANAPEKFDLTVLPNKTVTFFVSENGPATYAATDTFNSVLSQLRQATTAWNGIASSDLRVAFGGLENTGTPQNTPGGDIVFEDLPPGVYGFGGPSSVAAPTPAANGPTFVPIRRSTIHLNRNLTFLPGPSYNETFYMTAVHEMGHALGLQHTFTSATMSQATTRATTLSHPIDADDAAGLSVLYPNASFSQLGSITGRITSGANGLHLTSVVAIRAGGSAVSALTNQDGTYRIDGVPPGQYFVYAHPLPPDADIRGPWNAAGGIVAASGATSALFYPGTTDLQAAKPVPVEIGKTASGINIALTNRTFVPLYDAGVYGYFSNSTAAPVKPAYVNMLAGDSTVVASGAGLGSNGQAPGLGVQFLGGSARIRGGGVRPYLANGYTYVALDLGFNLGAATGPHHLVFNTTDFMHVLPAGIIATLKSPPTVASLTPNGDGTVTVTGANWNSDTLIYFDGLPAGASSLDDKNGVAVVTPPSGANGQTAVVTAYNTDGQNSQLVQASAPVTYAYGSSAATFVTSVAPASLPAGSEAMVEINTAGMNLAAGQVAVGFGTTDIVVRRIFILGPNRLQVNISIAQGAALSNPDVSVIGGFQIATATAGFQIAPATPGQPGVIPILTNTIPGLNGSYAGATVSINGANLLASPNATVSVSVGGLTATVLSGSATQINLQIPPGLAPGPAILTMNNGTAGSLPVVVNVDTPPATVNGLLNTSGTSFDAVHAAHPGDLVSINLSGVAASGIGIAAGRFQVRIGGVIHNALQDATPLPGGGWQLSVLLSSNDQIGVSQTLIVYFDGRSSLPATLPVARPDGTFNPFDDPTTQQP
jgi:uncharacterized protein (TIGR03437 family)